MYNIQIEVKCEYASSYEELFHIIITKPARLCGCFSTSKQLSTLNHHVQSGHSSYYYIRSLDTCEYSYTIISAKFLTGDFDGDELEYSSDVEDDTEDDTDIDEHVERILSNVEMVDLNHVKCDPDVKRCGCGCDRLHDGYDGFCRVYPDGCVKFE